MNLLPNLLDPDTGSTRRFLTEWHGAHEPDYGLTPEEIGPCVPEPLRDFYEFAGRWPGVVVQNRLAAPNELERADRHVAFYVENQGVFVWATQVEGQDPPVWGTFDVPAFGLIEWRVGSEKWLLEEERLSGFLLQMALFEAVMGAEAQASASWLSPAAQERLLDQFLTLPIGPWRWPDYPTRIYAREDVLAVICPNRKPSGEGEHASAHIGAKTPEALAFVEDLVDDSWEHYSPRDRADEFR